MNTKYSQIQSRRFIRSASEWICLLTLLILCALTFSEALGQDDKWAKCGENAFKGCGGCQGNDRAAGQPFNLQYGTGHVYDYYGKSSNDPGASAKLKACQQCIDQTCPVQLSGPPTPSQTPEQTRLPIIFLPGVAGSELFSGSSIVWPLAQVGGASRLDMELNPDGKTSARGANIRLGDILRTPPADFYGSFIRSLWAIGYKDGIDAVRFPYDWRYSNDDKDEHFARLDGEIKNALDRTGKKKVILIAHSMGGLIACAYVFSSDARASTVDSIITLGTPYLGAPKPYYGLINGYTFGNDSINFLDPSHANDLMKILLQNFPAAYQLLPQKPFINDPAKGETAQLSVDEANTIHYKGFINRERYTPTTTNDTFFNPELLRQSKQFWSALVDTNGNPKALPGGVKQYVIIGYGVSTVGFYDLEDWKSGILPLWPFSGSYLELGNRKVVLHPKSVYGDGTVPLWSGEAPAATAKYYIPYIERGFFTFGESSAHADLPANKTVQSIVAQLIDYESGLSKDKPDPSQYSGPERYQGQPYGVRLVELEKLAEFELHSDAHLRISFPSGKALGFNNAGGIDETLPGTFLSMDGVEYASIAEINLSLKVTVTGIRDGKFTLDVNVKRAGTSVTQFSYREVPVKQGTVAQVTMTPGQVSSPPPLTVTTDGRVTTIPASIGTARGPVIPGVPPVSTTPIPGPPSSGGIGGTWVTPSGDTITLTQDGDRVTGTYRGILGTGTLSGIFDGRTLTGTIEGGQGGITVRDTFSLRLTPEGRLEGRLGSSIFSVEVILVRRP